MTEAFNIDCMAYMKTLPDKYFELSIVDPPYGIGESGDKNHSRTNLAKAKDYKAFSGNDKEPPPAEYFTELFRVSKNQIIWGANHFISRIPFDSPCWVVWDKDNTGDFADCELVWTNLPKAVRRIEWLWNGFARDGNETRYDHPTQKPLGVIEWALSQAPDDVRSTCDPFMGSGTTGVACAKLGKAFTGIERERKYFDIACKRIEQAYAQPRLFQDNVPAKPEQAVML